MLSLSNIRSYYLDVTDLVANWTLDGTDKDVM